MLRTRVIPCLQLLENRLVKTVRFENPSYVGDPINTVRIFNELEVDELVFLDIRATSEKREPNLELLSDIASECFMPLSYGGGVTSLGIASKIFSIGFEKIVVNTHAFRNIGFIRELSSEFGSQSIVGSIDVKRNIFGKYKVYVNNGKEPIATDPVDWSLTLEKNGIGELLVTSINREGTWLGYDVDIVKRITDAVKIPVIANGGAGSIKDIQDVVKLGGASAAALGSMVVYQSKGLGVLINFPDRSALEKELG